MSTATARQTSGASGASVAGSRDTRTLKHHQGSVNHPRDTRVKRTLYVIAGVGSALIFGVPLFIAILRAFQPNATIVASPTWSSFWHFGWQNFEAIFSPQQHLLTGLVNSLIVAISTAVITAVVATMAGYGLSKFRFRGSRFFFGLILLTMMVPFQAILTPLYLQLNAMHLTDSLIGLILFYVTVNLPFGTFVMRNAFDAIPDELEDSALVDGASRTRVLLSVLRPMLMPGAATAALYAFLAAWTEFLGALTFLTKESLYTLPVALLNLQVGAFGQVNYGTLVAGSVVAMIPCIALYVGLQRFYVAGLSSGALKG
ncbi:carbohydrate ABC transporter permease [Frondihabitans australicus]|uniref:Carbohydrate ABC transporter membrane protein 2 (CUT1 family) n=1 Tax=Frondihabitans australicus TaxID=386892 RepID=A0A495ILI6_9MICO|nr:carbohydrate ABC transporter permease [Frondihabitans australicus]RKR76629.1 carbohydrate ABC transporter membrane protein 2 (CUT1 family) [Frondihabitans australicus]